MRTLLLAVAFAVAIASVCVTQPENANYTLPAISTPLAGCIDDTWTSTSITNVPEARGEHTAVWTGSLGTEAIPGDTEPQEAGTNLAWSN